MNTTNFNKSLRKTIFNLYNEGLISKSKIMKSMKKKKKLLKKMVFSKQFVRKYFIS